MNQIKSISKFDSHLNCSCEKTIILSSFESINSLNQLNKLKKIETHHLYNSTESFKTPILSIKSEEDESVKFYFLIYFFNFLN